jgi:predicted XRE-type DNA-binding protein
MEKEIWKDVPGYEGFYQASNLGNIKTLGSGKSFIGKNLKPGDNGKGYLFVYLWKNKKAKRYYVHRLILITFLGESKKQVNHKDCNKKNNSLENLEYVTLKQNMYHAKKNKRFYVSDYQKKQTSLANRGEKSFFSKLKEKDVVIIKKHLYEKKLTQLQIANIVGTTKANVGAIHRGKSWKHITYETI